jgi:hypothetical protein
VKKVFCSLVQKIRFSLRTIFLDSEKSDLLVNTSVLVYGRFFLDREKSVPVFCAKKEWNKKTFIHIRMDTGGNIRYIPFCETRVALVDQYSWPEKDTTERTCWNGPANPIYACDGRISRTLPLDMWPRVGQVHPLIRRAEWPHFGARDPRMKRYIEATQKDIAQKRLEGFYS